MDAKQYAIVGGVAAGAAVVTTLVLFALGLRGYLAFVQPAPTTSPPSNTASTGGAT